MIFQAIQEFTAYTWATSCGYYITIFKTEMDYIISYVIDSVQKRAQQHDKKKMPKLSKHKTHLSEIGKLSTKEETCSCNYGRLGEQSF